MNMHRQVGLNFSSPLSEICIFRDNTHLLFKLQQCSCLIHLCDKNKDHFKDVIENTDIYRHSCPPKSDDAMVIEVKIFAVQVEPRGCEYCSGNR